MDESLANDDTLEESGQKSPLIGAGWGRLRGEKSYQTTPALSSARATEEKRDSDNVGLRFTPDTYSSGRDPGSLWFTKAFLHSAKDSGIKKGAKVSYFYQPPARGFTGVFKHMAKDIRVIDNG